MLIHPFEATFPQLDAIIDRKHFINTAKENYSTFQAEGLFKESEKSGLFAYQISNEGSAQCGLIAAVSVQEYIDECIKKHEHTLVPKEEKQAILLDERQAVVKPILLVHRSIQQLSDFLRQTCIKNTPIFEFKFPNSKITHRFWSIDQKEEISFVKDLFKNHVKTAYIADGHHRFSAIARLYQKELKNTEKKKYEHLMCALFPGSDLQIHNFNRVIKVFSEKLSPYAFIAKLSHYAKIHPLSEARPPRKEHELTFYMKGEWFSLEWRPEVILKYAQASLPTLDVSMLNYCVLKEILACTDIRNDKIIKYIEGPRGLVALENLARTSYHVAFCLHALDWESFFRVIDNGLVLPPKSTWFEPRMLNGLIVQTI